MGSVSFICGSRPGQGIYRTGVPLFEALTSTGYDVTWYQCTDGSSEVGLPDNYKVVRGTQAFGETLSMGVNRLFVFPRKLKNVETDYFFLLDPTLLGVTKDYGRTIVKVHDLRAFSAFSDKFATRLMFRHVFPRLNRVHGIIVTTRYTQDLLEKHGVVNTNTYIIPETSLIDGRGQVHIKKSARRIAEGRKMRLLYVATDRPYKNIRFFLNVAKQLVKEDTGFDYTFTLVTDPTKKTMESISELRPGLLSLYTNPDTQTLFDIYDDADVLLFPSLYEGFGLPLIEAMSFGIPIIANNIFPMKEIVGDSGKLLQVDRYEGWIQTIRSLEVKSNYIKIATESFNRFSDYDLKHFREKAKDVFEQLIGPPMQRDGPD